MPDTSTKKLSVSLTNYKQQLNDGSRQSVVSYRAIISSIREELFSMYVENISSAKIIGKYTSFIDSLLCKIFKSFQISPTLSLFAVGGYGRQELHPYSDIDLLLISSDSIKDDDKEKISSFIRFLWDIDLQVGHNVSTIKQSCALAKKDITINTNLMESRALVDDGDLLPEFLGLIYSKSICSVPFYIRSKFDEQVKRHLSFDDTEYNLEPNIKNGPGGIRDVQTIIWVAARHFGRIDLRILQEKKVLSSQEASTLIRCRNFLWKLRLGLHLHAKRKEERLLFDHQRAIAQDFGYKDTKNVLAVESLMKRYYRTAKEIRLLNQTLLQFFLESTLTKKNKFTNLSSRFHSVANYIEAKNPDVFIRYPAAAVELFYLLQTNPKLKGIRAGTIRMLRDNIHQIKNEIHDHADSVDYFLKILRFESGQTHALRNMDTHGVLAKFFPDYHRIVGQMQHDLFHVYTVDAHSLFVVRNLRRFCLEKHKFEALEAFNVMAQVAKRDRLYLAALLHDIGKGRNQDHCLVGEKIAKKFCTFLKLPDREINFISWLVRNHLAMSWTAQREDITDPEVIHKFAGLVGDQQHLDCLYLITVADIKATSPNLWNKWKGKLLWDLYISTTRMLSQNLPANETISDRIEESKNVVLTRLKKDFSVDDVTTFWRCFDAEYFLHFPTDVIIWHLRTILTSHAHQVPLAKFRFNKDLEANQLLVYAPESESLLMNVTSAIDHSHLSIINAQIERLSNHMSLLAFLTVHLDGGAILDEQQLMAADDHLNHLLRRGLTPQKPKQRLVSRRIKHFPIKTEVSFSQSASGNLTIMQVIAQDRPALLFHVAKALLENKIHLNAARINTLGERVEDHFFITDRDAKMIRDSKILTKIKKSILHALDS